MGLIPLLLVILFAFSVPLSHIAGLVCSANTQCLQFRLHTTSVVNGLLSGPQLVLSTCPGPQLALPTFAYGSC